MHILTEGNLDNSHIFGPVYSQDCLRANLHSLLFLDFTVRFTYKEGHH